MGGRRTTLGTAAIVLLALGSMAPAAGSPPPAVRPRIAVVPFSNPTGAPGATETVMEEVWNALLLKGFDLTGNGRVDAFLRRRLIRARELMSADDVRDLAGMAGARYVLVGTIDSWARNGGPEVSLTARIIEASSEEVAWSGAVSFHSVQVQGLLALGRPRTLERGARAAVRELFRTLERGRDGALRRVASRHGRKKDLLAERPIAFRDPELDRRGRLRVAVLPFDNRTPAPQATPVVTDQVLAQLQRRNQVEVVDPGELRNVLIRYDIQPTFGLTLVRMRRLAKELDADALLEGTVLRFRNPSSSEPEIDLFARLRDARTGRILWAATTHRTGSGAVTLYDRGRIRGIHLLAERAVSDILSTWFR